MAITKTTKTPRQLDAERPETKTITTDCGYITRAVPAKDRAGRPLGYTLYSSQRVERVTYLDVPENGAYAGNSYAHVFGYTSNSSTEHGYLGQCTGLASMPWQRFLDREHDYALRFLAGEMA